MKTSRKKRIALVAFLVLAIPAVVLGTIAAAFVWRFYPAVELPAVAKPRDVAEANRQDLEALALLLNYDRSFSLEAALKFENERHALLAKASELTPAQMEMEVSRLVALSDNGHTTVGRRLRRLHRVPIRLAWFEEGLFVVRAAEAQANLLGKRVVRINGKAPVELATAFTPYVSGPPQHAKATALVFLVSPTAFAGVWPGMPPDKLTFEFAAANGSNETIDLASSAPDPDKPYPFPERDLPPQANKVEGAAWVGVLSGRNELPLGLRDPDSSVYHQPLEGGGLYIHITETQDDARGDLSDQLANILAPYATGSLRYAILDLRLNGGGNYTKTLGFTKALPKRIAADGKFFILTDNATFSAAIVTAARAKYFGGNRAAVLGEQIGDRQRFWAESGSPIVLPNSGIRVFFATGYHDWQDGCGWKDLGRCFWLNLPFDVPVGDLAPAKPMAWRFADYREGKDTVLEDALRQARPAARSP